MTKPYMRFDASINRFHPSQGEQGFGVTSDAGSFTSPQPWTYTFAERVVLTHSFDKAAENKNVCASRNRQGL